MCIRYVLITSLKILVRYIWASPVALVKNPPASAGNAGLIPRLGRSPGEGNGQPTLVFLPGKCHGQRSLARYSPSGQGRDRTGRLNNNKDTYKIYYLTIFKCIVQGH